jgi:hypothetical protein
MLAKQTIDSVTPTYTTCKTDIENKVHALSAERNKMAHVVNK